MCSVSGGMRGGSICSCVFITTKKLAITPAELGSFPASWKCFRTFLVCVCVCLSQDPHGGNLLKTADKQLAYLVRVRARARV